MGTTPQSWVQSRHPSTQWIAIGGKGGSSDEKSAENAPNRLKYWVRNPLLAFISIAIPPFSLMYKPLGRVHLSSVNMINVASDHPTQKTICINHSAIMLEPHKANVGPSTFGCYFYTVLRNGLYVSMCGTSITYMTFRAYLGYIWSETLSHPPLRCQCWSQVHPVLDAIFTRF